MRTKAILNLIIVLALASVAHAERYWIGPVPWFTATANEPAHYGPPAGVTSWIDLRTPGECGTAGTSLSGVAVFVTDDAANLGASYTNLGTDPERQLTPAQRVSLGSALRLAQTPNATALADVFYEAITNKADAAGTSRAKPIMPTAGNLRMELWLGGRKLRDRAFDSGGPEAAVIQTQLQAEYRAVRTAVQNGQLPANFHRKVLGYWVRKYRLAYRWFEPNDLPDESDIEPSTTYTETWPTTSSTLSSGQDQAWTEVSGDSQVSSGGKWSVVTTNTDAFARCNTALSSSDNFAQAVVQNVSPGSGRRIGPSMRYAAASNDGYCVMLDRDASLRIAKNASGTVTNLGTGSTASVDVEITVKGQAVGSSLTSYVGGVLKETVTDSTFSSGLRCGMIQTNGVTSIYAKTFTAGDAATVGKNWPYYYRTSLLTRPKWPTLFSPETYYSISP